MAKEGLDFVPLDCQLDEKFELIEAEFGLKGFAVIVKLFQRIYGGHGYYCEWNDDIAFLFASRNGLSNDGVNNNLIHEIVNASIRRGIFDKEIFAKYSVLTSKGIQKRYMDATGRRKNVSLEKRYLLLSDDILGENVNIFEENVDIFEENVDISKQVKGSKGSKEKRSEVKEKNYFPQDEALDAAFTDYVAMRKQIKKPMTDRAVTLAIKKLQDLATIPFGDGMDNDLAIRILNQSVMNSWQGLFPLKEEKKRTKSQAVDWSQI